MTKLNVLIEIEAILPDNLTVEEFMNFLNVQSCDDADVKINILSSDILALENK